MRLHATLLIALTLALPLAAADQDIEAGPVSASTANTESGDECGGTSGYHQRTALVSVDIAEDESLEAYFYQTCSDQDFGSGEFHSRGLFVGADHRVDGNTGPQVYVAQSDTVFTFDNGEMHMCGTWIGALGVTFALGCMPLGTQVPMAPSLP